MRYKVLVEKRLNKAAQLLKTVIDGMDNKSISVQVAYDKLKLSQKYLNETKDTLNLEHED